MEARVEELKTLMGYYPDCRQCFKDEILEDNRIIEGVKAEKKEQEEAIKQMLKDLEPKILVIEGEFALFQKKYSIYKKLEDLSAKKSWLLAQKNKYVEVEDIFI